MISSSVWHRYIFLAAMAILLLVSVSVFVTTAQADGPLPGVDTAERDDVVAEDDEGGASGAVDEDSGARLPDTPRLNARRFEQMIVDKIRSNILTEGSITELVRAVDEEMDGIASEQRKRLKTIDDELEDVKRRLGRIWNAIETSDIDIADASDRIKEHRERKERLEDAAADARAILSERRAYLDDVSTIAAYAKDMKDFLQESELTERRAFIESFVKEIIVIPGDALIRYTIPIS